jgi:hypothetical protein
MVSPVVSQIVIFDLPKPILSYIENLRSRAEELKKRYGDLRKSGRPLYESIDEVASIYYAISKGISGKILAEYIGIHENSIYNLMKSIESGSVAIYNSSKNMIEKISITKDQLEKKANEILKETKITREIKHIMDSQIVQEFIKSPIKIQKSSKHSKFYTDEQVKQTLYVLKKISDYIKSNQEFILQRFNKKLSNNPDDWSDEDEIIVSFVIDSICETNHNPDLCKQTYRKLLHRIPKFRSWFKGEIGSVRRSIKALDPNATLFLKDLRKLKEIYENTDDNQFKAYYDIILLHIWSGSREGYASIRDKALRLKASGVKLDIDEDVGKLDLDDEFIDTSLIGIKWDKAIKDENGRIIGFRIYEEKTKKEWILNVPWIFWIEPDFERRLMKYYEYAKKNNIKSVVKTILMYHNLNITTVNKFERFYKSMTSKIRKILNKPDEFTPHKIRSAHLSILAELGLHLEYAILNIGFGVGWDDIATAQMFYLRISSEYLSKMMDIVRENAMKNRL